MIHYTDSPLLRAIKFGRIIIIDEADKAPEHVVAIFRSLAGQGELTLSDGRRVCLVRERKGDIAVHANFRLILLANRPGYRECQSWQGTYVVNDLWTHSFPRKSFLASPW